MTVQYDDARIQREYLDMLDDENDRGLYKQKIEDMVANDEARLVVNMNDLRSRLPERTSMLLNSATSEISAFQQSLKDVVGAADPAYGKAKDQFFIGFEGSFGSHHVTPRSLTSSYLGKLVCVEGIVTRASSVRPKVMRSVHYCPTTGKTIERTYAESGTNEVQSSAYPVKDEDGNPLETEYGLCRYLDYQTFTIQEMPEKAPAGQLPRSVEVLVEADLVDSSKPGDRVQVVGIYSCLPWKRNGYTTANFRTMLFANNLKLITQEESVNVVAEDISIMKTLAKSCDIFDVLSQSIAPTIHGHPYIKKAILCQLLGGTEKQLPNGTHIRGDINVLLIGDPSVAKSQLLRYVLHTAARSVATTGRGSSGVGLTAAVLTDSETGERRLEAGAMVLADRGIVCIDEFDKMTDMDRTAIHEVMEQGCVTIAKAGIHARLNARCSVLAAANPVYGRYDQYKSPMENIGLQDSLLSRFDLLFVVLDKVEPANDRRIAEHVLRIHTYRDPSEQDGEALPMAGGVEIWSTENPDIADDDDPKRRAERNVFLENDKLMGKRVTRSQQIFCSSFVRKYVMVARSIKPTLTEEATEIMSAEYGKLRSQEAVQAENVARTLPVTARTFETLIRLSVSHAKARLSREVTVEDANAAVELVRYAYFKEVLRKPRSQHTDSDDEGIDEDIEDTQRKRPPSPTEVSQEPKRKSSRKIIETESIYDPVDEGPASISSTQLSKSAPTPSLLLTEDMFSQFERRVQKVFEEKRVFSVSLADVQKVAFDEMDLKEDVVLAALSRMQDSNKIMLSGGSLYLI